jgi:hypothetical protein
MSWKEGELRENWKFFGKLGFWGKRQRRGVHVRTLEKGSRGAERCFGGIFGNRAELRREWCWGNWDLIVFCVLGVEPRKGVEEGGPMCAFCVNWGRSACEWGDQLGYGTRWAVLRRGCTGGGLPLKPCKEPGVSLWLCKGRGVWLNTLLAYKGYWVCKMVGLLKVTREFPW